MNASHPIPSNWRILFVDDDYDWLTLFQQELDDIGLRVEVIHSIKDAMKMVSETVYDVVFCDLKMTYVDEGGKNRTYGGEYLIQFLRKNSPFTEVVVISGQGTTSRAITTFHDGIFDFLEKEENLFENIQKVLQQIYQKRQDRFLASNVLKDQEKLPEQDFSIYRNSLTLHVDKTWKVEEFTRLLTSIRNLYFFLIGLRPEKLEDGSRYEAGYLDKLWVAVEHGLFETKVNSLEIKRVHFASPGGISFEGLGDAILGIGKVLNSIIHYKLTREKLREELKSEELENERRRLENELKKLEIAAKEQDYFIKEYKFHEEKKTQEIGREEREFSLFSKRVVFLEERGFESHEIKRIVSKIDHEVSVIEEYAEKGKITGVSLENGSGKGPSM